MCRHQVFISSQIKPDTLQDERAEVRKVIKKFPHFRPWDWEENGRAGMDTPMEQCLEEVCRSRALVLIVSRTLTDHTRMEYEQAVSIGISRFIFFKQNRQQGASLEFRRSLSEAGSRSWREFKNLAELKTRVFGSLQKHCYETELAFQPTIGTKANIGEVEV